MKLREYQQRTLDELYTHWMTNEGNPLVTVPTGGGKSVIIAELCRLLFDTWPQDHPRTIVLVPSKELAEQNAAKLRSLIPAHLKVGYYSAALGKREADADVIVATIGSIANSAHLLGNIKCVVIDEAHLVNPDGREAGRYRKFLSDLGKYCQFRVVGYTATPFRGNGIWLTEGDDPLFNHVASRVTVKELLDQGHLAPLIRPMDAIKTRIDTDGIGTSSGDYNLDQLSERVDGYITLAASEACTLAADRKKWIAFTPTVLNANHLAQTLNERGITSAVVCGETPKKEREALIQAFRIGDIRCLVTVLALATGFDVPDVDCIIWLRPTQSPVLYVQGAGRGLRPSTDTGKVDCLWLDFSDTTERMGPVDTIKGRSKPKKKDKEQGAPMRTCPECGEQCAAALTMCPTCGFEFPVNEKEARKASNAAVMSSQMALRINTYEVTDVKYSLHQKEGKPDSVRVDYWSGIRQVGSEWLCFEHGGFATGKALSWWAERKPADWAGFSCPSGERPSRFALAFMDAMRTPSHIVINEQGKFPEIVKFKWEPASEPDPTHHHQGSPAPVAATV